MGYNNQGQQKKQAQPLIYDDVQVKGPYSGNTLGTRRK